MKSIGKVFGILIAALLILAVAAGFALTHLFDPNDYKEEIRQLVRDNTGIDLQLNGTIGWSLFPWLGLEVTDIRAAQADTPDRPFADARLLALSVRVMPLLRKEIQMSDVRLDGLALTLHRDAQGNSNWEHITRSGPEVAGHEQPETPEKTPEPGTNSPVPAQAINFDIDSLIVNSARVDYRDDQLKQQLTLENVQITTGSITSAKDIPLKISGFFANAAPLIRARLEMTAKANLDPALQRYQIKDLILAGEFAGEPLNDKSANFSLRGNLLLDQAQQRVHAQQLRLSLNQLKAMADISIEQINTKPQYQGQLSIAAVNLREFLPGIGLELPATSNNKALSNFELSGEIKGTENSLGLHELRIKLDQTSLEGSIASNNLAQGSISIKLAGDQINLDDYLPPPSKTEQASAAATTQASSGIGAGTPPLPPAPSENPWSTQELLPLATLRTLNLDSDLKFQQVQFSQLPLRNLLLTLQARHGQIELKKLDALLYDGNISSSASLNAKTDTPQLSFKTDIKGLPADKLLVALEQEPLLEGNINLALQLDSRGNSQRNLVANLNGISKFDVANGKLTTINVDQYLCTAIATLNRKVMSQGFQSKSTAFNNLGGSLKIRNGVAHNPDLLIGMPGLNIRARGDINLNLMGMDYQIGATLLGDTREVTDPACAINERYVGLEIPLRCRGPLTEGTPGCQIDQDGLGRIAARLAGSKLTEKLDEKLGEKVSPELKDALKGLFR